MIRSDPHRPVDSPNTDLSRFLDALDAALRDAVKEDPVSAVLVERCVAGLEPSRRIEPYEPTLLPACRHLERAVARVESDAANSPAPAGLPARDATPGRGRASLRSCAVLARSLARLAPSLTWYRRIGSESHGAVFRDGHANAFVIGSSRPEDQHGAAVGISLIAPHIRYPDHHHVPEELYLVLSPGNWRHGESTWFEPGIGGLVHNTPDIVHAMMSGDEPLLAIWCLFDVPTS